MSNKDFRCALPSRAGRTILLGDECITVGYDGVARNVTGQALAYCERQPHVWLPMANGGPDAEQTADAPTEDTAAVAEPVVLPEKADQVQLPSAPVKVILPRRGGRKAKKGAP